jgi:hypothetical protein
MGLLGDISFFEGGLGSMLNTFMLIIIGLIAFIVIGSIVGFFVWRRIDNKKYNIPLIIITPRSDGKVVEINNGVGGYFKSKKVGGITAFRVKRKGIGVVDIPPPPSSFLSAPNRTLILAQKGVDDYEPVNPKYLSYVETEVEVEEDGIRKTILAKTPILNLRAINQDATAWAFDNEETAKKRFTFISVWEKYQQIITMMIFIFILFLVIYINWIGLKDVVAGLKEVADALTSQSRPIITPGA